MLQLLGAYPGLVHVPVPAANPAFRRTVEAAGVPHAGAASFAVLRYVLQAIAWFASNVVEEPLQRLFHGVVGRTPQPGLRPVAS